MLMATKDAEQKVIKDFKTLLWLDKVDEMKREVSVSPGI